MFFQAEQVDEIPRSVENVNKTVSRRGSEKMMICDEGNRFITNLHNAARQLERKNRRKDFHPLQNFLKIIVKV